MSAYGDFVRKCCERTKHEATKATESGLTRYEWRNDHLAVIIRTNSVRYSAQDKNKTVLQWRSQDLEVGAQGVWETEVPQRGPGAKPLVGGSGGIASRKVIAVIKDIWLPNMHNFVYLAQRRSQEFSFEPNFVGACPLAALQLS